MAQLKKPLTKESVTALSLTFQAAMKMTIPCDLLYMFWDEACSAHMDLQDHRKEFFSIYCSMLQGSEEAKIPERFQECAQFMKTVLQDPDMTRFTTTIASFLSQTKQSGIQHFCLELVSRVCSASFSDDFLTVAHGEPHLGRLLFLCEQHPESVKGIAWDDFDAATSSLQDKSRQQLSGIKLEFHPSHVNPTHKVGQAQLFQGTQLTCADENRYTVEIAKTLIRPDGICNLFLIQDVKQQLIAKNNHTEFEKNIESTLSQLETNERLSFIIDNTGNPSEKESRRS